MNIKIGTKKKILFKNTILLYIMTAAKFILPVLVSACLTRRLGPNIYGMVTYVAAFMNYFILLFDFGFNYSATKTISQNRNDYNVIQFTINCVFTSKLILVAIGFVILICIIPFIQLLRDNFIFVLLYYLSTAANVLLPDFFFRGVEKMGYITLRYVIARLVSTLFIVLFVHGTNSILLIPVFYLLGTISASFFSLVQMKKSYSYGFHLTNLQDSVLALKNSFVYFLSSFATTALSVFNTLIMGLVNLSTVEIAYWSVAFQVVSAIQSLYEPITSSFYPHIVATKDYKFLLKTTLLLTIPVVIGCIITYYLSDFVIVLLSGEEYITAASVLRNLIPLLLLSFWAQMIGFPLLGAMGEQKRVTESTIIAAFSNIIMISLLIVFNIFSISTLSFVRNISELILFSVRLIFVLNMIKRINIGFVKSKEVI